MITAAPTDWSESEIASGFALTDEERGLARLAWQDAPKPVVCQKMVELLSLGLTAGRLDNIVRVFRATAIREPLEAPLLDTKTS